ncbi:G-protein coupled receptor GRL101-like [Anneissia japonica]|uniref:G-protein coupled receptor GRL101-like n=1 Tax=Anneissia japonica TaxID=1529436 RepID=UPI001425AA76|nr:G-protein coupled receptor GRL101-like [Anneissia japonica]
MECPSGTVKCPGTYCITKHLQCNTIWDCPNGEDEIECESYECPGMFRCHKSQVCVSRSQRCNGIIECPEADDEMYCNLTCPTGCICVGLSVTCQYVLWDFSMAVMVPSSTKYLSVSSVESPPVRVRKSSLSTVEDVLKVDLTQFQMLILMNISSNGIETIAESTFVNQVNLDTLVLSGNQITSLEAGCFDGLKRLTNLFIDNNGLVKIGPGVFIYTPILSTLHVENNRLEEFQSDMFDDLNFLNNLYTDDYQFCCMIPKVTNCEPPPDIFSSCEDLMRISFLRVMMWILGLSALVGNAFVIFWRVRDKCTRNVQSFLITNLAISDFLMGVYMIIIAGADVHYRGQYAVFATAWRSSFLCSFAGALSMISSEFSVFTLVIISLDRAISVGFPFSSLKITRKRSYVLICVGWFVAITLGLLPNFRISYFGDDFYGRPSVCLALPLTKVRLSGWEYSVAIVLILNLFSFLIIAVSYVFMYIVVKKTAASAKRNVANRTDVKMATKMAMIIFTDFCCWLPIIMMGIVAQIGSWEIPVDVYVWSATLILPINASLNPYLYTIFWINDAKKRRQKLSSIQLTEHSLSRSTAKNDTHSFAVIFDSNISRDSMLTKNRIFSKQQIVEVERELKRSLQFMHDRNIYHGHVTHENIIIYEEQGKIRSILLTKNAEYNSNDKQDLGSEDLQQLSTFLKDLQDGKYNNSDKEQNNTNL